MRSEASNRKLIKEGGCSRLVVRIPNVVYNIQENTVDEHTQTHSLNIIGSSENLLSQQTSGFVQRFPKGSFSLFLKECEFRFNYGLPTQQLKILKLWTRFNLIYYSRPLRKINGLMVRSFVLNSTFIKLLCHSTASSTQSVCASHRLQRP